ncbi:MAG: carboxypeptidase-like regulatory domain-containing protein [Chitinophagales bacterium]
MKKLTLFALLIALIMFSCETKQPCPPCPEVTKVVHDTLYIDTSGSKGTVAIGVIFDNQNPSIKIAGATVEVWQGTTKVASTTTNTEGGYDFLDLPIDITYKFKATATSYGLKEQTILFTGDEPDMGLTKVRR